MPPPQALSTGHFLRFDQKTLIGALFREVNRIALLRAGGLEVAELNRLICAGADAVCISDGLAGALSRRASA
jgi:hypothetical protein